MAIACPEGQGEAEERAHGAKRLPDVVGASTSEAQAAMR
jgi:hypothetical protein